MKLALACSLLLTLSPSPTAPPLAHPTDDAEELELFRAHLERRLAKDRYFGKVEAEWIEAHPPYLFIVQTPPLPTPFYETETAARWAERLTPVHERFRRSYAEPLDLHLRGTSPRLVTFVFASTGDFTNYKLTRNAPGSYDVWCNEDERMLLVQENAFRMRTGESTPETKLQLDFEAATQIMQGYGATVDAAPGPLWFRKGMALNLALGEGAETYARRHVVEMLRRSTSTHANLCTLSELLAYPDARALEEAAKRRVGLSPPEGFSVRMARWTALCEGALLLRFLEDSPDPSVREGTARYIEDVFKGRRRGTPLLEYLPEAERAGLEGRFWTHLWNENQRAHPELAHDPESLREFLVKRVGLEPTAALDLGAGSLRERLLTPRLGLATALVQVRRGRVEDALSTLDQLSGLEPERVARERTRIETWRAERDRFLEHLAGSKKRLRLEHEGERYNLKVTRFEDGVLTFGNSKGGPRSLPVEALDALALASAMGGKLPGYDPGWSRAYPLVLSGSAKAGRALSGDTPELRLLAEDAEHDYPGRSQDQEVAAALLDLDDVGEPADTGTARANLEALTRLWELRHDVPALEAAAGDVRLAARKALEVEFAGGGFQEELRGALQYLGGREVRITYDFSDDQQLEDWPVQRDRSLHKVFGPILEEGGELLLRGGELRGIGQAGRRHVLEFEGPQSVEYDMSFLAQEGEGRQLNFQVTLCSRPDGTYLSAVNGSLLEVCVGPDVQRASAEDVITYFDTEYRVRLAYDGKSTLTLDLDGERELELACPPGLAGVPRVFIHSDYEVRIDNVVLTGTYTLDAANELRERFVARELTELRM